MFRYHAEDLTLDQAPSESAVGVLEVGSGESRSHIAGVGDIGRRADPGGLRSRFDGDGLGVGNGSSAIIGECPVLGEGSTALVECSGDHAEDLTLDQAPSESAVGVLEVGSGESRSHIAGDGDIGRRADPGGLRSRFDGDGLGVGNGSSAIIGECPGLGEGSTALVMIR